MSSALLFGRSLTVCPRLWCPASHGEGRSDSGDHPTTQIRLGSAPQLQWTAIQMRLHPPLPRFVFTQ